MTLIFRIPLLGLRVCRVHDVGPYFLGAVPMDRGTTNPYCAFNFTVLSWRLLGRDGGNGRSLRSIIGAALTNWLGIGVCLVLTVLSGAAVGGELAPLDLAAVGVPETSVSSVPKLARAVLTRDIDQVSKALATGEPVDERVPAKEGKRAGYTPLILAAAISDSDIAKLLIEHGAQVTSRDDFGRSAFWYAALNQNVEVTDVLVRVPNYIKVINVPDEELERTPLHLAVRGNAPELVRLLLKSGADASLIVKDLQGETPVDYCKRHKTEACSISALRAQ